MRKISFMLFLILTNIVSGQEKKTISFDFGYGIHQYNMNSVNEFYIDSFLATPDEDLLREYIKKGYSFRLGVNYSPFTWIEIGLNGDYQTSALRSYKWYEYTESGSGETKYTKEHLELETKVFTMGIGTTFYGSELINNKTVFQKLRFGLEVYGGISFMKIVPNHWIHTFYTYEYTQEYSPKNQFSGQLGLKLEYDFTQTPIYTTLGLRAGYQFLNSGVVRDAADQV